MFHKVLCWCLVTAVSLAPSNASAFGIEVHVVTARIAYEQLTDASKKEVDDLLKTADRDLQIAFASARGGTRSLMDDLPELSPFEKASIWPDIHRGKARNTGVWHYINVPIDEKDDPDFGSFDLDRVHVISKINEFAAVLKDRSKSREQRARALLYLVHLIGDVHMPLHVGDNMDKGGNQTQVVFSLANQKRPLNTNLHALWDRGLYEAEGANFEERFLKVKAHATPESRKQWSGKLPEEWAKESLALAKKAYVDPLTNARMKSGARLNERYSSEFRPVLEERICVSGVRIGDFLNRLLDPSYAVPQK